MKLDTVHAGDARHMDAVGDNSVHLVVTSPPYNVSMEYGDHINDLLSEIQYAAFTRAWIAECHRVLVPGGRLAINVGNTGRKPYVYLNLKIVKECLAQGFVARQEFIWFKGYAVAAGKTSWGSWCDVRNPITRDCHEYIEVFNKPAGGDVDAKDYSPYRLDVDLKAFPPADVKPGEFAYLTFSHWDIQPVTGKASWHPAPFPVEIPRRLMLLYTRPGMVVLDPFMGSGSTGIAAVSFPAKRHYIGYELNPEFARKAAVAIKKRDYKPLVIGNGKHETHYKPLL